MSIKSFIRKVCVQPAVYWEYNGVDGFSNPSFLDPVAVNVRWDEKTEVISDSQGREYVSRAQILTPDDMKEQSYIWLGDLDEVPEGDPRNIENAFEIKKMDRTPLFKSTTFDVFIAYL